MSTNINTIIDILKEQYLPALKNQITTATHPFMEMIKKAPLTTGGVIMASAPYGINGGFGFGSEGDATPVSGGRKYKRFEITPVDMYVDIRISDKTIKLANQPGALISALDDEVKGSYEAAKWNVSRALFGDGSGILCKVTQSCSSNYGKMAVRVDDVKRIVEGLTVDLYTYRGGNASSPELITGNKGLRVISVDRSLAVIVVEGTNCGASQAASAMDYGFITVQNSYNKELTGLGAIFNEEVPFLYGYSKASDLFIRPIEVDADGSLTDMVIYDAVKKAADYRNSKIDLLMMGDGAFRAYQNYMRENNVVVCERAQFVGGASGYKVMVGSHVVTIVNESLVPFDQCWGVDTSTFTFVHLDFDFCDYGASGIFQLVPGTSYYRALLSSYGNLICSNPGGCILLTNCAE